MATRNPQVHAILVAARQTLSDPARWTTMAMARSADGTPKYPEHPEATCWCSIGAIRKHGNGGTVMAGLAIRQLAEAMPGGSGLYPTETVANFNDAPYPSGEQAHAEVLALFDKAIAMTAPEGTV